MIDRVDLASHGARSFLGASAIEWVIAASVALAVLAALLTARRLVHRHHARLAGTPDAELLEMPLEVLSRTTLAFVLVVSLFAGVSTLTLGAAARGALEAVVTIAVFWQTGVWATALAVAWIERRRRRSLATDRAAIGSLGIIGFVVRVLIWALVVLLTLDNLGVDITALVAGLGIGGIAVALAVQNVLGDLLASLSITLDRPFVVGDFLIVGESLGSVEHIGIKSTRLRSLSGEQIVLSNADLLASRLRNYGRMLERRVVFTLGITYETPRAKLEQIPGLIRGIVESFEGARFDRSHFAQYGGHSLDFETVYYVLSADYNRYMDIQQAINFRIHEAFERLQVEFAYPTRKVLLAPVSGPGPAQ